MSEKKWGFFPFDAMDYKAAQTYLDKKAEQDWVLDKVFLKWFARFVPAEGRRHCVELDLNTELYEDTGDDYLQLCEDAGWEPTANVRRMRIFRSKIGRHPVPLQTDNELEAEKFWKKYVRRNFLTELILLLILAGLFLLLSSFSDPRISFTELLCSNAAVLGGLYLLVAVLLVLRNLYRTAAIYIRFRRTREIVGQKQAAAWAAGLLTFLMKILVIFLYLLYLAEGLFLGRTVDVAWSTYSEEYTATPELCQSYPVITAADLGLEYSQDSRYLDGRRALLAERLDYSEITDGKEGAHHILTTERYECVNEKVAAWIFDARRAETARGSGFLWGKLDWDETTADYGFDRICFARDHSYLLALEGDTVILVGASDMDLTDCMDTLWSRLELND